MVIGTPPAQIFQNIENTNLAGSIPAKYSIEVA
jgi:hypothetical protein